MAPQKGLVSSKKKSVFTDITRYTKGSLLAFYSTPKSTYCQFRLLTHCISELGEGWAPAILDTEEEMNFIKEGQKKFSDNRSYRIGGEATQRPPASIDYSDYIPKYGDRIYWMNGPGCKLPFDTTKASVTHCATAQQWL